MAQEVDDQSASGPQPLASQPLQTAGPMSPRRQAALRTLVARFLRTLISMRSDTCMSVGRREEPRWTRRPIGRSVAYSEGTRHPATERPRDRASDGVGRRFLDGTHRLPGDANELIDIPYENSSLGIGHQRQAVGG